MQRKGIGKEEREMERLRERMESRLCAYVLQIHISSMLKIMRHIPCCTAKWNISNIVAVLFINKQVYVA